MGRLELLWAADEPLERMAAERRGGRPPGLFGERVAGEVAVPLRADRPSVIANFVASLDGIVALGPRARDGGSAISGGSEDDRVLMALLRTLADAVVVGAGTVRAASLHEWTPRGIHPAAAATAADWRAQLGLAPQPTTIVVTARGWFDRAHPGLSLADVPVVVATTDEGARRIRAEGRDATVRVEALGKGPAVAAAAVVSLADRLGARLLLCEGGPHLLGAFLEADLLDELHLTLAPQLLGRDAEAARLGLVEGIALAPTTAPWGALRSIRRAGDHLFLRYAFGPRAGSGSGRGRTPG